MKTCKVCRARFENTRPFEAWCSPECGFKLAVIRQDKARHEKEVRDRRETKEKLKRRQDWYREALVMFQRWVRLVKCKSRPCISCGKHHTGQYHGGHYVGRGRQPSLAFEEDNCWKQCKPCNTDLSGNMIPYRKALIIELGIERVEWLETEHPPKKYTVEELKNIIAKYSNLIKEDMKKPSEEGI